MSIEQRGRLGEAEKRGLGQRRGAESLADLQVEPEAAVGLPWQRHSSSGAYSHGGLQKASLLDVWKRVGRGVSLRVEGLGKEEMEEGASGHY